MNEITYIEGPLTVTVASHTQWATVYWRDGRIAGTLSRRRVADRFSLPWTITGIDGKSSGHYTIEGALRKLNLRA
jgi:hypothetical protein